MIGVDKSDHPHYERWQYRPLILSIRLMDVAALRRHHVGKLIRSFVDSESRTCKDEDPVFATLRAASEKIDQDLEIKRGIEAENHNPHY